jgi:hypothetical protein
MSENQPNASGERPLTMKEKLLAQRKAEAASQAAAPNAAPSAASSAAPASASASASASGAPRPAVARPVVAKPASAAAPAAKATAVPRPLAVPKPSAVTASARSKVEEGPRNAGKKATSKDLDEVRREARALKEKDNKVMMVVWVIAVVFIAIAGGAYLYYERTKGDRDNAIVRYDSENAEIESKLKSFKIDTEADAQAMLAYIGTLGPKAKRPETKDIVTTGTLRASNKLKEFQEHKAYTERLVKLEADARASSSMTAEAIDALRRDLETLSNNGAYAMSGDTPSRLGALRGTLDKAYVNKLHSEVAALPTAGKDARQTLAKYSSVEDIVNALFIKSIKDKNKSLEEPLREIYKAIITESDEVADRVFTPEEIEKTPWQDLLRGDQVKNWVKSDAPGFTYDIDQTKGLLRIIGPNPDSKGNGIVSIGDRDKWRDFVLEMDVEIKRGGFVMYFRAPLNQASCEKTDSFTTEGDNALTAGTTYSARIRMIGSKWQIESDAPEFADAPEYNINWTMWRAGAVAFEVPVGADILIKKMRIKALR